MKIYQGNRKTAAMLDYSKMATSMAILANATLNASSQVTVETDIVSQVMVETDIKSSDG